MVSRITGIPQDQLLKAWDLFTSIRKDGDIKKVATIIYAVGWTQHSFGTQIIRTAAMVQLLMGNVGRAGGGVNALRGHSNIQGATDMAGHLRHSSRLLEDAAPADKDLKTYLDRITPKASKPNEWESFNYWSNTPKFMVSFLKAMYGPTATKENDFCFPLSAQDRPQVFLGRELERHVRRQGQRILRLRHERRDDRSGFARRTLTR